MTYAEAMSRAKQLLLTYSQRIKSLTSDLTTLQATHATLQTTHAQTVAELTAAKAQVAASTAKATELQSSLPTTADEAALADLSNLIATASK